MLRKTLSRKTLLRKTTLAACVMFAAPALLVAQEQPTFKWVDATYNEDRPMTRMAAPDDLQDPGAIELSSANGTADRSAAVQRAAAITPVNQQPTPAYRQQVTQQQPATRTYVGQPVETQTRTVVESPAQETVVQYSNEPRTIVYENAQPIERQEVRRVEYPAYQTQTSYYVEPVNPNPWHSINNGVQRVQYAAPATYSAPTTTIGNPVIVNRPVSTITYNNPPVLQSPAVQAPVVAGTVPVPNATVYPVDRTTFRPVLPIVPMNNNSYVGRGLLGQPKVYTEGQPIRNGLRYILP